MIKVFNETTRKYENFSLRRSLVYGIVYLNEHYVEYGFFMHPEHPAYVRVLNNDGLEELYECFDINKSKPYLAYSNMRGCYIVKNQFTKEELLYHQYVKGMDGFPYSFNRMYEAVDNFSIFKGKQVIEKKSHFRLSEYMSYTFGLEFETSMGYIPEDTCYKDGLIPLRDGSISGLEYSTIVLQGDEGLSLLFNQQIDDLKKFTDFNKECSLHVHLGGYPITPKHIFALYVLCKSLESYFESVLPPFTFHTSRYKATGKDYCNYLPKVDSFNSLYTWLTDNPFLGSLYQAHPSDIARIAKWKVTQRYLWINLINAICYKGPKTVEFRMLRPTFNKRLIMMWLWILNAILKVAETEASNIDNDTPLLKTSFRKLQSINNMHTLLFNAYPEDLATLIETEFTLYTIGVKNQASNGDYFGRDISFIDNLLTGDSPLL